MQETTSRQDATEIQILTDETENRHNQVVTGLLGFGLSVVFIFWGLLVLVRFWVYTNILYNIFVITMLLVGIIFNISSLNLLLTEEIDPSNLKPFIFGTVVPVLWNVLAIILPLTYKGYFEVFSDVPFLMYSDEYYSGESYNKSAAVEHPFVQKFTPPGSSFFDHPWLIITFMAIVLGIQLGFWIHVSIFYVKVVRQRLNSRSLKTM